MATQLDSVHRFNIDEYHRMGELGVLPESGVELIDGCVVFRNTCRRWRFTTEDYYQLAEAGVLAEDDRVELIEGEILDMSPIGSRHAGCVKRLNALLQQLSPAAYLVAVQDPLRLVTGAESQPDLMLLRPRGDFYSNAHPTPPDVLVLIEVADRSAGWDRTDKAEMYARAGIAEYWLVDLTQSVVLVHNDPSGLGYLNVRTIQRGDRWQSRSLPDLTVSGTEVFG